VHFSHDIVLPNLVELNGTVDGVVVGVAVEVVGAGVVIGWEVVVWLGSGKPENDLNFILEKKWL